jgi:hypothetical protein
VLTARELVDQLLDLMEVHGHDTPVNLVITTGPTVTRQLQIAEVRWDADPGMAGLHNARIDLRSETLQSTIHPERRTR